MSQSAKMKYFSQITSWSMYLLLIIAPVFFLPFTQDYVEINKQLLLVISVIILFLVYAGRIINKKELIINATPLDIPFILLFLLSLVSTIVESSYKMGAILSLNGPMNLGLICLLYILVVQLKNERSNTKVTTAIIVGAVLLSFYTLIGSTGIVANYSQNDIILKNIAFSPIGSPYIAALFLISVITMIVVKIVIQVKSPPDINKKQQLLVSTFVLLLIIAATTLLLSYFLKTSVVVLPLNAGIEIMLDVWKRIPNLLLGIGPGNFVTAFSIGRPVWLNTGQFWNVSFNGSTSYIMTLGTELGLGSIILFFSIIFLTIKSEFKKIKSIAVIFALFIALSLVHIVGISNTAMLSIFIIVIASIVPKHELINIKITRKNSPLYLVPACIVIICIGTGYTFGRIYIAEIIYKNALNEIVNNNGQQAYTKQAQAIRVNKYVDKYHRTFSQINLALANSLSANTNLSDEDKQRMPRLIQQSIDETSITIALSPTNPENWQNRATVYGSIAKNIPGSEKFAINAYKALIELTPGNPQSLFLLGRFYYSSGKSDAAIEQFEKAIKLKPNWANAHYNLAAVYIQSKEYQKAQTELEQTLILLPKNSSEAKRVKNEIKTLTTQK